ncbi:MAG: hypothetical protein ACR2QF_11030 [Geminicoccaceae bacterium]
MTGETKDWLWSSFRGVTLPAILAAFGTLVWMLAETKSEIVAIRGSQRVIEAMGIGTRLTSLELRLEQIFRESERTDEIIERDIERLRRRIDRIDNQ